MLLLLYAVLALIPLLGVAWIFVQGILFTVDGLFMALICASMSGIFALSVLFELRSLRNAPPRQGGTAFAGVRYAASLPGAQIEQGRVHSVQFYESHTGEPNKSIVTLSDGGGASRVLVLQGYVRNALPVGKKVEITARERAGGKVLLDVSYF